MNTQTKPVVAGEKHAQEKPAHKPYPRKQNFAYGQKRFSSPRPKNGYKQRATMPPDTVKISFLGGLGEIGKNLTVFETENDIIIFDCGMTFAGPETPGVELIIPDISYLRDKKEKVKAFVITHGHEDHIGALPYVLSEISAPLYASRFTLALIENKMREHSRVKYKAMEVKPRQTLKIGDFSFEFIHVNHSIAGAMAVAITTPAGIILHTGDFKVDNTPINQDPTDLKRIGEIGKKGVKLLMCESTNVEREGWSRSETHVMNQLEENVFKAHANERLIIATFASNVYRMQEILSLAEKYKRKVAFTGRSMLNISQVAMKLGVLHYDRENIIAIEDVKKYAENEVCILTTGSQGEQLSALTRMSEDNFAKLKLTPQDCVAFSSSPIPGNEKSIINVMNRLVHKGVGLVYDKTAEIHASGHGCQDEIAEVMRLAKPEFVLPVHGEYMHLDAFKKFALKQGFNDRQIIVADLGNQVQVSKNTVRKLGFIKAGARLIDGNTFGEADSPVMRDRKELSKSGFVFIIVNISTKQGRLSGDPIVVSRGLLYAHEENVLREIKTALIVHLKNYDLRAVDPNELKKDLKKFASNTISRKTRRKPMVLCTVLAN